MKGKYTITFICKVLNISPKSYYKHMKKISNPKPKPKITELTEAVLEEYSRHKGKVGYRNIHATVVNKYRWVKEYQVYNILRAHGLKCVIKPKGKKNKYTKQKASAGNIYDNVMKRDFSTRSPNTKWVTDSTEIKIVGTEFHFSAVLDVYNNQIKGYGCSQVLDSELVKKTFEKALKDTKTDYLIIHSDQGTIYRSNNWKDFVEGFKNINTVELSMSRKGNPWDNACIESFFSLLKSSLPELQSAQSVEEATRIITDYIDYYNNHRTQYVLGYKTPATFCGEKRKYQKKASG